MVNVKVKTATAKATATAHERLRKAFYKRPTGPMYPSMGLPGGEKGSAVVKGTCVRACVGMPGVCVLRVCVRERGEAANAPFVKTGCSHCLAYARPRRGLGSREGVPSLDASQRAL